MVLHCRLCLSQKSNSFNGFPATLTSMDKFKLQFFWIENQFIAYAMHYPKRITTGRALNHFVSFNTKRKEE